MVHSQECLKGWIDSNKNPKVVLTVYKKEE